MSDKMIPVIKFRKDYGGLVISAEIPVIPIDDIDLLLVVTYGVERDVITSPVVITAESFSLICDAIHEGYMFKGRDDFWIMEALGQLSLRMKS